MAEGFVFEKTLLTSIVPRREEDVLNIRNSRVSLKSVIEPDLYSQADISAAVIAIQDDLRAYMREDPHFTSDHVLKAVKEEEDYL